MFKIIDFRKSTGVQKLARLVSTLDDPMFIDITGVEMGDIKKVFNRDYVLARVFDNIGTSTVQLRDQKGAKDLLARLVEKAKEFQREIVLIFESPEHLSKIRSLYNEHPASGSAKRSAQTEPQRVKG